MFGCLYRGAATMTGDCKVFRCPDTGEQRAFFDSSYTTDTTTMHNQVYRTKLPIKCYKDAEGYRIDRCDDGQYQDKWSVVWEPVD